MTHTLCAQSGESSYLNLAMEKIESGECDAAQRYYNVYKELSGITSPELEQRLENCLKKDEKVKSSEYAKYLDMAMEELDSCHCKSAQKHYNTYKALSDDSISSIQALLDSCKEKKGIGYEFTLYIVDKKKKR